MPFDLDLEALEASIMAAPPKEVAPLPDLAAYSPPAPDVDLPTPEPSLDLMGEGMWMEQWFLLHDMGGGLIQARTGAPCPLGEQARNEGGRTAGKAAYDLIKSHPALAKMFLSTQSTFMGQLAAIGMHGFACVQVVKASRMGATLPDQSPEFTTTRSAGHE